MSTKRCVECKEEKDKEECFFKAGTSYQSRCKPCHNAYRMTCARKPQPKSGSGINKLSTVEKTKLKEMIEAHKSIKDITAEFNMSVPGVYKWRKKGWAGLPLQSF